MHPDWTCSGCGGTRWRHRRGDLWECRNSRCRNVRRYTEALSTERQNRDLIPPTRPGRSYGCIWITTIVVAVCIAVLGTIYVMRGPSWLTNQDIETIEYSIARYSITDDESSFSFVFKIEADGRLQSFAQGESFSSSHPVLSVPSDCQIGPLAAIHDETGNEWSYEVVCQGALYESLKLYVDDLRGDEERERSKLPFTVVKMNVFYSLFSGNRELNVTVKPNIRTMSDESYKFAVYDEDGNSKGANIVSWSGPALNVKEQKSLSFLGITSDEFDAYSEFGVGDVKKFFSVLMEGKDINVMDNPLVKEWLKRNVPVFLEARPVENPPISGPDESENKDEADSKNNNESDLRDGSESDSQMNDESVSKTKDESDSHREYECLTKREIFEMNDNGQLSDEKAAGMLKELTEEKDCIEIGSMKKAITPMPTPDPQVIYPPLAERFGIWRSDWIAKYGDPPHKITNSYSSTITINLPMCGVVIGYSGRPGYYGFESEPFVPLGQQEVALAGGHVLGGSGMNQREYTLEVSPPQLLGQGSVTTEYNNQLRKFLDSCGG